MSLRREENLQALRDILKTNSDNVVVFIGAGASKPLGIRPWKDLIKQFAEKVGVDLEEINTYLSTNKYPEAASEIYKHLSDHDMYLEFMSEKFEAKDCRYTSLHETLIENFSVILTTNYDNAFEKFCQKHNKPIATQKLPHFSAITLFQNKTIVYLHGNNKDGIYIFLKNEYDYFYPSISKQDGSDDLERFLYEVISTAHLIFIGFSFNDKYFFDFFKKVINEIISNKEKKEKGYEEVLKKKLKTRDIQHFVITSEAKNETLKELGYLEDLGVLLVITYKNDYHAEIESIIESVMPSVIGSFEEDAANAK